MIRTWLPIMSAAVTLILIADTARAEIASQRAREHFTLSVAANECVDCDRIPPASTGIFDYWSAARLTQRVDRDGSLGRSSLSDKENSQFSGIGAIVCEVAGKPRATTAFLVGAFDIVVTVAHAFETDGVKADPANCVYTTSDSLGQVRERIPLSYFKSEWELEDGAFGQPTKDLAVVRLSKRSDYAQRTMPLGKFNGSSASVLMIGFADDLDVGSLKHISRGNIFERRVRDTTAGNMLPFTHDMDATGLASGAPVIDERTGIIIGLHSTLTSTRATASTWQAQRNAFIPMNDWLERTLMSELHAAEAQAAQAN